jgi:hypothetical protein
VAGVTPDEQRLAVQRRNARALGLLLGLLVILIFALAIAKIGLGWSK